MPQASPPDCYLQQSPYVDSLKRNKAFHQLLSAPAQKFDGSNRLKYKAWKDALNRDAKDLHLNAAHWLELLHARTSKEANDALQPALIIQQETSAENAVRTAWSVLNEKYSTPQRPSQQLITDLLHGPMLTINEPEPLFKFSTNCEAAVFLKQRDRKGFASLDDTTTQQSIFSRLSEDLNVKWYEYRWNFLQSDVVPFEQFARWINGQPMIHRLRKDPPTNTSPPQSSAPSSKNPTAPQQENKSY